MIRKLGVFIAVLVAVWVALRSQPTPQGEITAGGSSTATGAPSATRAGDPKSGAAAPEWGFRSRDRLNEHFQKHGREFGAKDPEDYQALAEKLRDAPTGADVLEVVRPSDGVISRFDKVSGAFLAAEADGTIRTFFKPNDGEAYFRRQARRRPSP